MKKLALSFLLFFLLSQAFPQRAATSRSVRFQNEKGQYRISSFASNIFRIKFYPIGYEKNENISDAVTIPDSLFSKPINKVEFNNDTLKFTGHNLFFVYQDNGKERGLRVGLDTNEMIFGGGERALPLNRRGYKLNLYNNPWYGYGEGADNLNYSVPFITSSNGYGLFFDNASKGYLDIGKSNKNVLEYGASSGEINVYVIFGNYQQILQSYHKLTGTQPLPPRWAFGNLMSRFGYTSEAQVKDVLQKMKEEDIPVDAVIFDLFWFGDSIKHTMGNLNWVNKTKWPDPKKMIADFKKEGIQTILVTEPFFVETSKNYQASKKYLAVDSSGKNPYYLTDFYFGKGGLIDIFRNDSKVWFWQFYKKQMQNGVEAWWGDLGEPERHPSDMYHHLKDIGHNRLFSADEVHNIYGHTWTKMLYQFYAKEYPNKRLFSLNRSGFAGSQRYSIFPWTGDVSRSWSGLRAQLPVLLGMSMSGVPYVHSDAGGFAGGEGDNELYVRWLQFAAFTPIFRPHGTALYDVDKNAFSFPSEAALIDTPYRNYAKDAIAMRYSFLPYNYSLAYQQAKYGKPLMAPLYYYFPTDTTAINIQDQYMWGENILVAPVLQKEITKRSYYLPEGNWLYSSMEKKFVSVTGGKWLTDSVSLEKIPFFIREGAFIALKDNSNNSNTLNLKSDSLAIIHALSSNGSSYQLYIDDGSGKENIRNKNFELVNFKSSGKVNDQLLISISREGKLRSVKFLTFIIPNNNKTPGKVMINNKNLNILDNFLKFGKNSCICTDEAMVFQIDYNGQPTTIKIIW